MPIIRPVFTCGKHVTGYEEQRKRELRQTGAGEAENHFGPPSRKPKELGQIMV